MGKEAEETVGKETTDIDELRKDNPFLREILSRIAVLDHGPSVQNDPNYRRLTTDERKMIVIIVTEALEATTIDRLKTIAEKVDKMNESNDVPSAYLKQLSNFYAASTMHLPPQERSIAKQPNLFSSLRSEAARQLARATYPGDRYISDRYCEPITKALSNNPAHGGRNVTTIRPLKEFL